MSKFVNELDERIYQMTLDGCQEETGDVTENGYWYGMLQFSPNEEILDEIGNPVKGAIVCEDSQGFVTVDYYDNLEKMEKEWRNIEEEVDCWYEFEENPDDEQYDEGDD